MRMIVTFLCFILLVPVTSRPLAQNGQLQTAFIEPANLPADPGPQETPITCWAASMSYIFDSLDHKVAQRRIVERYFGPGVGLGNPSILIPALNSEWTDDQGLSFTVSSKITDHYWGTKSQVDNTDVVDALQNGTPVFYGTSDHAMVLLAVTFAQTPTGPYIVSGVAWDPNPEYHRPPFYTVGDPRAGIRNVSGPDLIAKFVAITSIDEGAASNPATDSTTWGPHSK
jgi:hypothetical protein